MGNLFAKIMTDIFRTVISITVVAVTSLLLLWCSFWSPATLLSLATIKHVMWAYSMLTAALRLRQAVILAAKLVR
jgi:hypothetical protein